MRRVHLFHWNEAEAQERAARLEDAGFRVEFTASSGAGGYRALRDDPPDAVVIDLGRLPSPSRSIARSIRESKATRGIPIVFVGGAAEKVEAARKFLPDAVYAGWDGVARSVREAIASPPEAPVVPSTGPDGYSGTPLPKKLGIRAGAVVLLLDAPEGLEATLGKLPEGASLRRRAGRSCDLALWFVRSRKELEGRFERTAKAAGEAGIWIAWPKKTSGVATDLTEDVVRERGLARGLVDIKVCAIDATWSGLRFARRAAR